MRRRTLLEVGLAAAVGLATGSAGAAAQRRRRMRRMPVGFVGHGAPTLALDRVKGAELSRWAADLPEAPRAMLVVSAHWQASPMTLGSIRAGTPLVYDFWGFDEALYRVRHDAPPWPPALAQQLERLLARWGPARSERGLDHGTWVPLRHFDREAQIPTLQLSMPRTMQPRDLFEVGRVLAPLRDEGVWILGSGNLTHNLRRIDFAEGTPPESWALEFDEWVERALRAADIDALLDAPRRAPAFALAHPTDEHYRPLLIALGAAAGEPVRFPVTGFEYRNLSRRCVEIG